MLVKSEKHQNKNEPAKKFPQNPAQQLVLRLILNQTPDLGLSLRPWGGKSMVTA
jgi:hypothetical protein